MLGGHFVPAPSSGKIQLIPVINWLRDLSDPTIEHWTSEILPTFAGEISAFLEAFKDVRDRKTLHTEFSKSSVYRYASYIRSKIDGNNLQLPTKKYSVSFRLLTAKK